MGESRMKAVILTRTGPIEKHPLRMQEIATPTPGPDEILLQVSACGVCRSNLHMIEGEWVPNGVPAKLPIVPGHEIVGRVAAVGEGVVSFKKGDRAGIQPLWSTCGRCEYCLTGREQLCQTKQITGETVDGGYTPSMSWRRPSTPTQCPNRSRMQRQHRYSAPALRRMVRFQKHASRPARRWCCSVWAA